MTDDVARIPMGPKESGLAWFNRLDSPAARDVLCDCLDEPTWARTVADQRPFNDLEALNHAVSRAINGLTDRQLLHVLAGRPRLGGPIASDNRHSPGEHRHLKRDTGLLAALGAAQQAYEDRYGFIFLIRAAGRSPTEIMAELRQRMHNPPDVELDEIRRELAAITTLRLESILPAVRSRIVLINPNSNTATTAMLETVAVDHLSDRSADFDLKVWQPKTGPRVIANIDDLESAGPRVLRGAAALADDIEHLAGMIVCAIGDPGVDRLQADHAFPVVGLGAAAIRAASLGGRRFGLVTTTPALAPALAHLARRHATAETFTGVRLTHSVAGAERHDDPDLLAAELATAVRSAVTDDGAEAVIIGGGPLAEIARILDAPAGAVIVEPLVAALDEVIAAAPAAATGLSRH